MAWYSNFLRYFRAPSIPHPVMVRAMPRGRTSVDTVDSFSSATWLVQPPASYEQNWELLNLSSKDFDRIAPTELLEMLAGLSPEVSRARWDYLRACNAGWEFKAFPPGGDVEDPTARKAVQAFIDVLIKRHESFDVILSRLFDGPFVFGAACAELVLDKRGRLPLDIATPVPASIRFRKRTDPELGEVWQPGQWQGGNFKPLDIPTFSYLPIDPHAGTPYATPMAAPALFTSLFLLGMMHDLKRVVQQQGYPRIDVSIDIAQLLEVAPHLAANTEQFNNWVAALVSQAETAYSQLQPDDAYIHTSNITVNRPVGTVDASSLGGIDGIIKALERMAVRALKTNGLLLDLGSTTSESEANRKWEMYVAGIKSVQHPIETLLGRLFTLALEAQGIQANVVFTFSELRAAEELRDAQTEAMKIANAKSKYEQGWFSQDEASEEVTGHPAVEPTPIVQAAAPELVQDDGDGNEQPARVVWLDELRQGRAIVTEALEAIHVNGFHKQNI